MRFVVQTPPRSETHDVGVVGDLSLFLGVLAVLSPFVTAMPLESAPI
jgi:hypothetical protein